MLSFDQMMNRMDQLASLGILYPPVGDKRNTKFTDEFFDLFAIRWYDSIEIHHDISFNTRIRIVSGVALTILHPELNKDDLLELSKICFFIWVTFYNVTEEKYTEFFDGFNLNQNRRGQ